MIIDINAFLGDWPFGELPYSTADGLLGLMDRNGIDMAAVSSMHGIFYKLCDVANRRLWEEVKDHGDRLIPVGTVNPAFPGWERDLKQCRDDFGARAIKLLPAYHGYTVASPECSDAIDAAADLGLPVMLSVKFEDPRVHHWTLRIPEVDLEALGALVAAKRGRRLILASVRTASARTVLSAAGESDCLVEISHMEGPIMCVQDLVRDIGSHRVLLGTQAPFMNPKGAMLAMGEPGFAEDDRARVLGENAKELLGL